MTIGELPRLETERLVLWVPGPEDAARMLAYRERNRDHLARWSPRPPPEGIEQLVLARLERSARELLDDRALWLVLASRQDPAGAILGDLSFRNVVRDAFQACHLGYQIDRDAEGKGLMREALEAAIGYVFGPWRLHRIMANYMPINERSGRLLRRLGFTVEGYARDYLWIDDAWRDHILTALTSEAWSSAAAERAGGSAAARQRLGGMKPSGG